MSALSDELKLDVDFETARALHRVVRGMNDGECPKCHLLDRQKVYTDPAGNLVCSECGFEISYDVMQQAMQTFAPVMEKNLTIFEDWRAKLKTKDKDKNGSAAVIEENLNVR